MTAAASSIPSVVTNAPAGARGPIPADLRAPDTQGPYVGSMAAAADGTPGKPVPAQPGSWTFSAIGDYGAGTKQQARVAANILASKPSLVITMGDNVYADGTDDEYRRNFEPPHLTGTIHKTIPMLPTLGNHDARVSTAPYFKRFPHLDGARYYSADRGGVHFVALDSNETLKPGSPQYRWLERDLSQAKEGWKVLYFHHPMMSSTSDRSEKLRLREYLGPLLAKHGVDLVLTGHDHTYERSTPLNDHGTLHVRSGNGGASYSGFKDGPQPSWSAYRETGFGHVNVEVTPTKLVGRYMTEAGKVTDTWVIEKPAPGVVATQQA